MAARPATKAPRLAPFWTPLLGIWIGPEGEATGVVGACGAGDSAELLTKVMVTSPGELTGKVAPEMTTAVDSGGSEVVKTDVMWVTEVGRPVGDEDDVVF